MSITHDNAFPAYAGMNRPAGRVTGAASGVPRVCGDEPPHGRVMAEVAAAFPAYAGMNRGGRMGGTARPRVPRVCGDEPTLLTVGRVQTPRSPRMRG